MGVSRPGRRRRAGAGRDGRATRTKRRVDLSHGRTPRPGLPLRRCGRRRRPGNIRSRACRTDGCNRSLCAGRADRRAHVSRDRTICRPRSPETLSRCARAAGQRRRSASASRSSGSPIAPLASTAVETVRIAARARRGPPGVVRITPLRSSAIARIGVASRRLTGRGRLAAITAPYPAAARQLASVEAAS